VSLPYPDCGVQPSDCQDIDVINTLDGFNLQPRLSIAFDGAIDPSTVTSETVFLINLGSTVHPRDEQVGRLVGINQVVWDTLTNVLHVESDELLAQHTRYALIVTEGVRDATGRRIQASNRFRHFRQTVKGGYQDALVAAVYVAKYHGIRERDIVTASVFTTQSITPVMERIRDHIKADLPDPADFRLGPNGERTVFSRSELASISWRQHTTVSPPGFTTVGLDVTVLDVVPGAVATVAYGTFVSPEYRVPGEYIPAVGTRNDIPAVQAHERISFTLYLPSGAKPTAGWPIAIIGVPQVRHAPMAALASTLARLGCGTAPSVGHRRA
jgi:virulence factor lipase-like protein